MGNVASKFYFTVNCSRCTNTKTYEATKVVPDELVNKFFSRGGWILGRNRSNDICPTCVGVTASNRLATKFNVVEGGVPVPTPQEVASTVQKTSRAKTSAAIEKLFGPKPTPAPEPGAAAPVTPEAAPPEYLIRVEQRLDGITNELSNVRAASELLVDSVDAMTKATSQQTQALANMAAMLARASEGISSTLHGMASLMKEMRDHQAKASAPVAQAVEVPAPAVQPAPEPVAVPEPAESPMARSAAPDPSDAVLSPKAKAIAAKPSLTERMLAYTAEREAREKAAKTPARKSTKRAVAPVQTALFELPEPAKEPAKEPTKRGKKTMATAVVEHTRKLKRDGKLAVYSNKDLTNEKRFYTTVSVPRRVWDLAGFGHDHRVWLYESAGKVRIERVSKRTPGSGQVIKRHTPIVVRLQSTKFGDLKIDNPVVEVENGVISIGTI